jgi:hypothetical protein
MKRRQLIELEDLNWWPATFRNGVTEYLVTTQRASRTYLKFVPRLAEALRRSSTHRIIDLCSGAGGPWPDLLPALRAQGLELSICLTDKYPNVTALKGVTRQLLGVTFEPAGINATDVPSRLVGFRTLFTAFHHFKPEEAQAILASAVRDGQGIAIFEGTSRSPVALATMFLIPAMVWLLTPGVRPFRWGRLLWTYVLPVLPLAVLFDGLISCLRTYTPAELLALAHQAGGDNFDWEAGVERPLGSPFCVPYLIGVPRHPAE